MNPLVDELLGAIVGSLFLGIGAAALAAALSARPRRDRAALAFGAFSLLYGLRLCAQSALVRASIPWPGPVFDYIDAFVNYTILIPAGLFVEAVIGPGWHQLVRRTWQAAAVYAAAAVAHDLWRGQPFASMGLNDPFVLLSLSIIVAHVVGQRKPGRWPIEVRAVAVTAAAFTVVAVYETVSERGVFGTMDAEPLAMLLFTASLGWFVLARERVQADRFVAISRELELAREIQHSLLPQQMPALPGLRIRGTYLPMSAVAGDFYDVVVLPDGRVTVIVADVSGHGVPAALVASMVKIAFAAESERYDRPGDILGGINRALTGKFERAYVTACCVTIDRARETIAYAAAGHPPAIVRRSDGGIERIEEGGIVLTLLPAATYATVNSPFHAGDRLLLFTDGLLEAARGAGDDFFGDAELARVVAGAGATSDISDTVLRAHRAWIGEETPLSDDVTLVVVECVQDGRVPTAAQTP